ncbi:hypothetical protein BGZ63DRAFT_166358 [Mariannaea sp. PMI_226]|nr:hypothetical protein BGZ63DRAFT_166358 [Mariannaea sp. PMI_226]
MAPANGSAKQRRQAGSKLAQLPKPVVPVIPLPYMKRQAAAAAAAASTATVTSSSTNPPPPIPRPHTNITNGSGSGPASAAKKEAKALDTVAPIILNAEPANTAAKPAEQAAVHPHLENGAPTNDGTEHANHQDSSVASTSEQASTNSELDDTFTISDHSDRPIASEPKPASQVQIQDPRSPNDAINKPKGIAGKNNVKDRQAENAHSAVKYPAKIRPPPVVSPTRYQMPPPFQPANRPMGPPVNGEIPLAHRPHLPNGGPHLHQPHHSNGSIHFGAFHDSGSSSPAPPLSGGIAPPPGITGADGRHPYMGHAPNGFPPMMPYGADMVPATTFDSYARPAVAYGPMDPYPPYGNNFGSSTPHSFHDSQASAYPEDNNMYSQYPSGPVRNGATGPGDDSQSSQMFPGPEQFRMMPNHGPPPHMIPSMDGTGGWASHMWSHFMKEHFADCYLGLRLEGDSAPSLHIPAHRLVLSRSPRLATLLTDQPNHRYKQPKKLSQPNQLTTDGSGFQDSHLPTLLVEAKSKWVGPEAFSKAVSRLYGNPHPLAIPTGSPIQQMDYALSYAAAGHLLMWEPVIREGCEAALQLQLINWQTVERALEFALEGYADKGSYDNFKYDLGSRMILDEVVRFIINSLPLNFAFDSSVAEPEHFSRFPSTPTPPTSPSAPAIAHGSAVHLGRSRRSQQITNIQFGDLPQFQAIASRILLNIPFSYLKRALESAGSSNTNGWANAEYRYHVIRDVVAERERRRCQALEAIQGGHIPGWESVLKQLSTPEPRYFNQWSTLGWREEMVLYGSPSLGRVWAPVVPTQNGTTAEYP